MQFRRCLDPGIYVKHIGEEYLFIIENLRYYLDHWLDYFLPSQLYIVDGQRQVISNFFSNIFI